MKSTKMKLLVILFLIKLKARKNISKNHLLTVTKIYALNKLENHTADRSTWRELSKQEGVQPQLLRTEAGKPCSSK